MTPEQEAVVTFIHDAVTKDKDEVVLVPAVAGAGKTYLLQQIVKNVPHKTGIYLSYNKSIATEAATKFPPSIKCLTANALAYRSTVKQFGLKIGNFGYREITETLTYEMKSEVVATLKEYCLSRYLDLDKFAKDKDIPDRVTTLVKKYLELMYTAKIECSHDFYMKVFHMGLAEGNIQFQKEDFLLIDESGDLNEVTLEIFKLFPAKVKIAVGDACQNVYGFNHTVNAFALMADNATTFRLTQSFRVSSKIAARISTFCQKHISADMIFAGIDVDETDIVSRAIIARTNSGLISSMISLVQDNTSFNLVRSPQEIFKVPLMLCYMKYQGEIKDPTFKHLQDDVDEWFEDPQLAVRYKSLYAMLFARYEFDPVLATALRLVMGKGKNVIIQTYNRVLELVDKLSHLTLTTAHSVKGLEYDEVIIQDDLNSVVSAIFEAAPNRVYDEAAIQELNLYYVACSRARKSLINAACL